MNMLICGYGTMASAMVEGWLASGLAPGSFTIYNPRPKDVPRGTRFTTEVPDRTFDFLLLGFKPHMLAKASPGLQRAVGEETVVLSIVAGVELATLGRHFPPARAVVRFMPNLAVALRKSPNALISQDAGEAERAAVTDLAERVGSAEWIEEEAQFDLVTALAGSGPGFVYRFIDALAAGAAGLGLKRDQAERLAVQMVDGAGALAAASEHSPGELAQRVASPGGMTQKGLDVLDEGAALEELMTRCLAAARDRGRVMAEEAREKR